MADRGLLSTCSVRVSLAGVSLVAEKWVLRPAARSSEAGTPGL